MTSRYNRILLKLSGEALAGEKGYGIDPGTLKAVSACVKGVLDMGIQVGIVIGGGNIHRGIDAAISIDRVSSDYMGMLATVMNSLALKGAIEAEGCECRVMSAIEMPRVAETYIVPKAIKHLSKGRVVIFAGGTGSPFFTTDTTAALRAIEIGADVFIKATKVNGIYDKDPVKNTDAKFFPEIDYDRILSMNLKVMDATAVSLCRDNNLEMRVMNIKDPANLGSLVNGRAVGSIIRVRRDS